MYCAHAPAQELVCLDTRVVVVVYVAVYFQYVEMLFSFSFPCIIVAGFLRFFFLSHLLIFW